MAKITDITKPIDLLHHAKGTGHKRLQKPVYMNFMPPCNSACPAGENIQAWLDDAQAGRYEEAFQQIVKDNPLPAIMGRICVKPCETGCNRNHIDTTVNIHAVERYIGDLAIEQKWKLPAPATKTGKRVMVVGAGPSGLSAAYHLTRLGHEVEIFEADALPGGLLRWGVPEYRLPKNILDAEIHRILDLGIRLHVNYRIHDLLKEKEARGFDAVYLSIGGHLAKKQEIPGESSIPTFHAFQFLRKFYNKELPAMGTKVIIYGGGKLAMYIARIIKRLGLEAIVLYEGDRKTMQANDYEADDAMDEGVDIQFLHKIKSIDGQVVLVEKMEVVKNKPASTGEEISMEADSIIFALGQEVDTSLFHSVEAVQTKPDGGVVVDANRMTGYAGIFAGGDMLPGEQKSSTNAIGQGKKAAKYMDAWLMGTVYEKPPKPPTAGYKRLHIWYQTEAPASAQPRQKPELAAQNFNEVVSGLSEQHAQYEAQRCLSCGNCFECDACYGACPEDAIIKLGKGKGYEFNYDACTGCSICFEQCPCHAIEMIPEPENVS